VQGFWFYLLKNVSFTPPDLPGKVVRIVRTQLGTPSTALHKSAATFVVMTAACERVHVVKGPDNWDMAGNPRKKRSVIHKTSNPMQIDNFTEGHLSQRRRTMFASIVSKIIIARWS
jgi:hypothetical protein